LLSPLPDIVFLEDEPKKNAIDLDNYFLDIDGDVLYYTTGNTYIIISINNDHTVDLSSPLNWFGVETVYFRATDPSGALQQDLVTITVLPVNDAPLLLPIPTQYGNETERWVLDLEPFISDVDNNISELEISVDNEFIVVSGKTLIFLGSKDLPGQVEVSVSDGEFRTSQKIDIHLRFAEKQHLVTMWDLFVNILPFLLIIIIIIVVIASLIYRKKNRFVAEEVFLIHTGGTLINHLLRRPKANVDDVIFSGMFTAVQEFIKDTFTTDANQSGDISENQWVLDELTLGKNKILIERSEHTYLAVIFNGEGSNRLRKIVAKLLDKIETKYSNILPTWDGDIRALAGTKEILSLLIKEKDIRKDNRKTVIETPGVKQASSGTPLQIQQKPKVKTQEKPVQSRPIVKANAIIQPKETIQIKGLLKSSGDQAGAARSGLPAWPLNKIKHSKMDNIDMNKLPIALHINPKHELPKTIVIKKGEIFLPKKEPPTVKCAPACLDPAKMTRPVKITMPDTGKEFEIDPSRSLLQQLAEIEDREDS